MKYENEILKMKIKNVNEGNEIEQEDIYIMRDLVLIINIMNKGNLKMIKTKRI